MGEVASPIITVRRSLGNLLRKHGSPFSPSHIEADLPVNDDELEKQQRKQQRLLQQHEKDLNSPGTPSYRRIHQGSSAQGLTNVQISEHYKDCIRLSTENKITKKNAFGLHLIDYMADVLKSKENETNFQLASCALDASAKIYSYRVDSVHSDALNMVSGLGMKEENKGKTKGQDADMDSGGEENLGKGKKHKSRKSATIETNIKNITLNSLEIDNEPDALFQKMTASFDECGVGGLLSFNLCVTDDDCELMMDAGLKPGTWDCERCLKRTQSAITLEQFKDRLSEALESRPAICKTFRDFEFLNCDFLESIFAERNDSIREESQHDDYAFDADDLGDRADDMDGVFHSPGSNDPSVLANATITEATQIIDELGDGTACQGAATKQLGTKPMRLESVTELASVLADQPSEYSYFDLTLLSAWGGPNHWKLYNIGHKAKTGPGAANLVHKRPAKKEHPLIDFSAEFETEIEKSKNVSLSKLTMQKWDADKIKFPKDLHFTPQMLSKCFLKPDVVIRIKKTEQPIEADDDDDDTGYNYNNAPACESDYPATENDASGDEGGGDFPDDDLTQINVGDVTLTSNTVEFTGENLVQQPYKIEKLNIQYTKRAKKINVRKVINTMWKVLTKSEDAESEKENMGTPMMFSEMFSELPKHLPERTIKELSVPYAFVAFLHVVNEKGLKLTQQEDLSDYKIEQAS